MLIFKSSSMIYNHNLYNVNSILSLQERRKFFRKCVIRGHTAFFVTYEFLVLYNYMLYVSEKSKYPSPLLRLLSVTLTYADPHSALSIAELLRKIKYNSFTIGDGWDIFQRVITGSFELGAFFLQFLSWWNQENYDTNIMNLPAPPPPKV